MAGEEEASFTLSQEELYRLALSFYKEQEGKGLQVPYQLRIELVALTQQAKLGSFQKAEADLPPLGTFDIIGKERRAAWEVLGDMDKDEAKAQFLAKLMLAAPTFEEFIATKTEQRRLEEQKKAEEAKKSAEEAAAKALREEERQVEEVQRRAIQDALNKQTFSQFRSYAEQQCPGNPDQQALLIKQLQEQHYYQYMQRLHAQQGPGGIAEESQAPLQGNEKSEAGVIEMNGGAESKDGEDEREEETSLVEDISSGADTATLTIEDKLDPMSGQEPEEATMWTRKEINIFKETIRKEEGEAVLKIGHGETVTVRVPTHLDGRSLYWEFATDGYDIGFGLFFEWVDPEDTQVTVHISDSEDDSEEYITDEEREEGEEGDPEMQAGRSGLSVETGPPTSCIIPTYRRDCHEEVYAGSHTYPRQGVYQLKFDNSYSLWRSKTLYYRVYYTR